MMKDERKLAGSLRVLMQRWNNEMVRVNER